MTIDKAKLKALAETGAASGNWLECPATDVLALLAEIEQLREAHEQVCTNYNRVSFVAEERGKERDQLKAEIENLRRYGEEFAVLAERRRDEAEVLRKEREGKALVPVEPSDGLLMSMAIRSDHALGCPGYYDQKVLGRANSGVGHARMLECALGEMRKLHEEVVGTGFYSPEKDADYAAMAKEASHG